MNHISRLAFTVVILASISLCGFAPANHSPEEPAVKITLVPVEGEGSHSNGTIGGSVSGVSLKQRDNIAIVIYSFTDRWWVQPTAASPYTSISESGDWETDIHLGYVYAALLVRTSYRPEPTTDALPKVGGDVLAIARVPAKKR